MSAASLLAQLRDEGISISSNAGRLVIDAPVGAVTAELRVELVKRKAELIATLETAHGVLHEDAPLTEARTEIARLLAIAYRRYAAIQRVGPDRAVISGKDDLANSGGTSVHGVVP
jgi:hypothetical protein